MNKLTYKTYLTLAKVTEGPYDSFTVAGLKPYNAPRLLHMALGLATEALELQEAMNKKWPEHEQILELSDICWFSALACEELGVPPRDEDLRIYPPQGIQRVYDKCEEFASRIKAGLVYGSPAKKSDPHADYWKSIPAEIFGRTVAIGNNLPSGCILTININKLRARFGDKFSAHDALNRDTVAEAKRAFASEQGKPEDAAEILADKFGVTNETIVATKEADGSLLIQPKPTVVNFNSILKP